MIAKLSYQQLESRVNELEKELHLKQEIIDSMKQSDTNQFFHEKSNLPHHMTLDKIMGETETDVLRQSDCFLHSFSKKIKTVSSRRSAEGMWTRTIDGVNDIVTIQDKNLTIIRANKAAHQLFNANHGALTGKHCYEVFTGKSEPCPNCPLLFTLKTGSRHSSIIKHEKLNKIFHVNSSLIPAGKDAEQYLVHVAHDITNEMAIEKNLQEVNECFSKAFESNPAPMVISEISSGLFINVNQRWVDMLGYSKEELIGGTSYELDIWDDPGMRNKMVAELSSESSFKDYPVKFRTKSGEIRSVLWSAEKITINSQDLMLSLVNDVTEQEKAERELRESEEKFALAFNSSPDAVNINRLEDGLYVDINGGFTDLTGFTAEDVNGRTSSDINIWHDPADREKMVRSLNEQGYCENLEAVFRKKDGGITLGLMSARVILLHDVPHVLSITRDISKIRQSEREAIKQKLLFETMFNAIDDGVVITDTNLKIQLANKGMYNTFGYNPEELVGKTTSFLHAGEDDHIAEADFFDHDSKRKARFHVAAYKHKSGREFPGETFCVKLYAKNNGWIGNLGIMRDVSSRQKAEVERDRLIAAIEQTSDAIVITDRKASIQYVNPAFELITGYSREEVLGQNPRILKSGEQNEQFYQDFWQILNSGRTFKGRMVNRRKDGTVFTEEVSISPICDHDGQIINFVAVKRDISEQILLESQLRQAQKMEAVGRLTGGVAHDFNNTLGIIIGYTEMALDDVDPAHKLHNDLTKILEAAERSANIVRQLLAFSRKQTITPKILDLNKAVLEILKMLYRLIGEQITLSWTPEPDSLMVKMDPTQIDQILANLCVNAKDAIDGSGKITIETTRASFDKEYCANHIGFQPGEFVQLTVSDNGCGIDKETQQHIFEPFFSTKELGRGTGLGLSTVYGIVKQNNGFINVYSELGRGTTVKIYLPSYEDVCQKIPEKKLAASKTGFGETVLLVEDELVLLDMAQKMLEIIGYNVLAANRPSDALKIAEEYPSTIDLLFTDVVMPEMTGKELANAIHLHHPGLKILFMSGYTANVIAHNGILDEGIRFIQKPFSMGDLAYKIRDILNVESVEND